MGLRQPHFQLHWREFLQCEPTDVNVSPSTSEGFIKKETAQRFSLAYGNSVLIFHCHRGHCFYSERQPTMTKKSRWEIGTAGSCENLSHISIVSYKRIYQYPLCVASDATSLHCVHTRRLASFKAVLVFDSLHRQYLYISFWWNMMAIVSQKDIRIF